MYFTRPRGGPPELLRAINFLTTALAIFDDRNIPRFAGAEVNPDTGEAEGLALVDNTGGTEYLQGSDNWLLEALTTEHALGAKDASISKAFAGGPPQLATFAASDLRVGASGDFYKGYGYVLETTTGESGFQSDITISGAAHSIYAPSFAPDAVTITCGQKRNSVSGAGVFSAKANGYLAPLPAAVYSGDQDTILQVRFEINDLAAGVPAAAADHGQVRVRGGASAAQTLTFTMGTALPTGASLTALWIGDTSPTIDIVRWALALLLDRPVSRMEKVENLVEMAEGILAGARAQLLGVDSKLNGKSPGYARGHAAGTRRAKRLGFHNLKA